MSSSNNQPATKRQPLTTDGKLKFAPCFTSPQELVFAVHEKRNLVVLKRLRLTDGSQQRVHPSLAMGQFDAAYSRDGHYHAFVKSSGDPQLVLVIQDLRDNQEHILNPGKGRDFVRNPSIAPDSTNLVFSLSNEGGQQIASVNMQAKSLARLTTSSGLNATPSYSPDGERIAFSSSRDGNFEIYVMDRSGQNVQRLTNSPGFDHRPVWSPDGRRIAFTSNRDGNYEIYVISADGARLQRVTHHSERDDYAAWHPDGQHLAVVSERHGKCDLYLIEVPG